MLAGKAATNDRRVSDLGRSGDAEIDDLGASNVALRNNNIVGRDVAMNDTALMGRVQTGSNPPHEPK